MGRFARVVAVEVPHHVTQRGNARQIILEREEDRVTYLALLRQYSQLYGLGLTGRPWFDSASKIKAAFRKDEATA